jgi:hypothetical protein
MSKRYLFHQRCHSSCHSQYNSKPIFITHNITNWIEGAVLEPQRWETNTLSGLPPLCITQSYYMDNGVLLETKTLVELICHYIRDQVLIFSVFHPLISPLLVKYEVRKFPAIFIVVVLKIQMVFGSYIKRN